jgi:thioredoxin 1
MKAGFNELIKSETPTLVDFYADWCGPCKAMAPTLEQLSSKMGDKVKVIKINVDKNQNAAALYKVQSIPTLILFQNGQIKWRQAGALSLGQLEATINQFAKF